MAVTTWRCWVPLSPDAGGATSSVTNRSAGHTMAGSRGDVTSELRLRLKAAFEAEGIEIPFPHRTIVTAGQKAADGVLVRQASEG